jgi:hypothetical protein
MYSSTFSSGCEDCGEMLSSFCFGDGEAIWSVLSVMPSSLGMLGFLVVHEGEQSSKEVEASKDILGCQRCA